MEPVIAWLPFCFALGAAFFSGLVFVQVSDGSTIGTVRQWHNEELRDGALAAGLYLALVSLWVFAAIWIVRLIR